jgi:hypothetical protein
MRTKTLVTAVIVVLSLTALIASCGEDEDEDGEGGGGGIYACSYEKRGTGCNNYIFGAWEAGCDQFNSADYYITPEQVCANLTSGGLWCGGTSCCITTEYQNVILVAGTCY